MNWTDQLSGLQALDHPTQDRLLQAATEVALPAGQTIFHAGDRCQNYLFVLSGTVRVQKVGENGREIVLYRVNDGGTCILTTSCLLGQEGYAAEGITETPVRAVVLPAGVFAELLGSSTTFRNFVFVTFGQRMADLMALIDEVVFRRIDVRLARHLLKGQNKEGALTLTHQELAVELGTAREVISRQLKEFERRGWVALGRGHTQVLETEALKLFAV